MRKDDCLKPNQGPVTTRLGSWLWGEKPTTVHYRRPDTQSGLLRACETPFGGFTKRGSYSSGNIKLMFGKMPINCWSGKTIHIKRLWIDKENTGFQYEPKMKIIKTDPSRLWYWAITALSLKRAFSWLRGHRIYLIWRLLTCWIAILRGQLMIKYNCASSTCSLWTLFSLVHVLWLGSTPPTTWRERRLLFSH